MTKAPPRICSEIYGVQGGFGPNPPTPWKKKPKPSPLEIFLTICTCNKYSDFCSNYLTNLILIQISIMNNYVAELKLRTEMAESQKKMGKF